MRARALLLTAVVALLATACVTISRRPPPASPILIPTPLSTSPPSALPTATAIAAATATPTPDPTAQATADATGTPPTPTPAAQATATAELPNTRACRDDTFALSGYSWDRALEWRFNPDTVPDRYDAELVLEVIRRSFDNVTNAVNDCGLPDRVSAEHVYRGTATGAACGDSDDVNLVGFGRLRGNLLAVTCPWIFDDDTYAEIDIEIDNRTDWTLGDGSAGEACNREFYLEAVMTHEVGHAFGLAHVGERRHGALTMSTTGPPCDNTEASLGLGDVRGLEALYGP